MEFRVLGPLEVCEAGAEIAVGGSKQRTLLAILLLNANTVVASERLIDLLWDELPPPSAAHSLQVQVSKLRKIFAADGDARLETRPRGYVLRVEPGELDLHRFDRLVAQAQGTVERDPTAAAR